MANGSVRIDVDTSGAQRNVQELINKFNGMTKPLTSASNAVSSYVNDMKNAGQSLTTVSKKQVEMASALGKVSTSSQAPRQALSELKKTLENVTVAYNSLTSQEKASPFGQALKGSINELTDRARGLQRDLSGVSASLRENTTHTEETSGVLDKLAGKLGMTKGPALALSGAMAAIGTAAKVAKDSFMSMEGNIDEWGRTMEGAKGAYSMFLETLNGGNWDNFFDNLSTAVRGARDLYDALDRLGSIKANNSVAISLVKQEIMVMKLRKQNGEKISEEDIKAKEAELTALENEESDAGKVAAKVGIKNVLRNKYNSISGIGTINDGSLEGIIDNLYKRGQKYIDEQTRIYHSLYQKAQHTYTSKYTSATGQTYETSNTVFDINKLSGKEKYQYGVARAVTEGESQYKEFLDIMKQAVDKETSTMQETFKNNRYFLRGSHGGSGTTDTKKEVYKAGELGAYQEQISKLQSQQKHASSGEEYQNIQTQIDTLNEKIKEMTSVNTDAEGSTNALQKAISELQSKLASLGPKSEEYYSTIRKLVNAQNELKTAQSKQDSYTWLAQNGGGAEPIDIAQSVLKADTDAIDGKAGKFKPAKLGKAGTDAAKSWQDAASAISSAASAMQGLGDTGINVAAIIAEAVANIALGFAKASASSSTMGIWGWIAASTAGLAQMASLITSIHSATGYAEGGVVGGNSYSGDKLWARLNSGEVVIPANLAEKANSMLDNSAGVASRSTISGEQIISVLRATTRRRGKSLGELI